jgi:hypothetical protein
VLLEFNELSPTLMSEFIAGGELPNFKALRDSAQAFVTDAEEAPPNLEPWIQWVTVHSGLTYDEHGIFHLGDGDKLPVKSLWDLASDAGLPVWVCGSMNVRYDTPIRGAVLPDPWSLNTQPYPQEEFAPYFNFVQRNVQEYTNDRVPLAKSDYARFLQFMVANGLSASTAAAIVRQLATERFTGKYRWKRATILDRLQWDVFKAFYKKIDPAFSTFFLNSTAHLQHMHWRNMDPAPFKNKPSDEEQQEYQDAILYGYRQMDRIVGEALELVGDRGTLILASALGQQPCLIYEDIGGKTFYRPRVFEKLLEYAGVRGPFTVAPVMAEEFHIYFDTAEAAERAAAQLRELTVNGRPAVRADVQDGTSVFAGCKIFEKLEHDVLLHRGGGREPWPFFRVFYRVEGIKSGMHHPDGILWMRMPGSAARQHEGKVPLRDLAPTLLTLLGLQVPQYMSGRAIALEAPRELAFKVA